MCIESFLRQMMYFYNEMLEYSIGWEKHLPIF